MKKTGFILLILLAFQITVNAQKLNFKLRAEKYEALSLGEVTPQGWIRQQMQNDMKGFVGNLDIIVPSLINDPIYYERIHKYSKAKDLGNLNQSDGAAEQYKWWNSETQSNWRDGYIRNAILLNDSLGIEKAKQYVYKILSSQDDDGYLGIYAADNRYNFSSENGELWAKSTLFRGLLAFYQYSKDEKVWNAIVKAVDNLMQNYPAYKSNPFSAGTKFLCGVPHGLTVTDAFEKMYQLTKDIKYRKYALFLYQNFSENLSSEKDAQLPNILNPDYKLKGHGAHTYEHLRTLIIAAYSSDNKDLQKALEIYLQRIEKICTPSGGPIGDEWIFGRIADATNTGYEYCSIQELLDSYSLLLQKTGKNSIADKIENIFFNAAQSSRNPFHSCVAYLKTDNSYEMTGTRNGAEEKDEKQTSYKYSPAHQDVAVCCNPNAGRITPYYVQNMWMKKNKNTLIAALLGPCKLKTSLNNIPVEINEITEYPYSNEFSFMIKAMSPVKFELKVRKPSWVTKISCSENYTIKDDYIVIEKTFGSNELIKISFEAKVLCKQDNNNENYFTYGALLFACPILSKEIKGKSYTQDFNDYLYSPVEKKGLFYIENNSAKYENGKIKIQLLNKESNKIEQTELIPLGKTILRQVTFTK